MTFGSGIRSFVATQPLSAQEHVDIVNSSGQIIGRLTDDGSGNLVIQTSDDGASFTSALTLDASTGLATGNAVQSSATDATAGKLLKVGAFGLGSDVDTIIADVDALTTSGFYCGYGGGHALATPGTNPFPTWNGAFGMTSGTSSTGSATEYLWQIAIAQASAALVHKIAWRAKSSTASGWLPWSYLYGTGNLLGTVSQSSGVPTGSVIERGSNANGEYVRFADGTQICTRSLTLTYYNAGICTNSCVFAATFAATPSYVSAISTSLACTPSEQELASTRVQNISTTSMEVRQPRVIGLTNYVSGDTITVNCVAFGRWF